MYIMIYRCLIVVWLYTTILAGNFHEWSVLICDCVCALSLSICGVNWRGDIVILNQTRNTLTFQLKYQFFQLLLRWGHYSGWNSEFNQTMDWVTSSGWFVVYSFQWSVPEAAGQSWGESYDGGGVHFWSHWLTDSRSKWLYRDRVVN